MELELQSLFGLLCTAVVIAETPQLPPPTPPAFGLINEGAIGQWSSLCNPLDGTESLKPVLWICDILVRVRIRGSVQLS
jgi:hypothetical protein